MSVARHAPAPFIAPVSGDINQRLAQVADAINRKADSNGATVFPMIGLTSPDGTTWKVTIDNTGSIHTEVVVRP